MALDVQKLVTDLEAIITKVGEFHTKIRAVDPKASVEEVNAAIEKIKAIRSFEFTEINAMLDALVAAVRIEVPAQMFDVTLTYTIAASSQEEANEIAAKRHIKGD